MTLFAAALAAAVITSGRPCAAAEQPEPEKLSSPAAATLKNLQESYNRETNAREKYEAYARKADEEGYQKVAQLFRAAARSEQAHSELVAKGISGQGSKPARSTKAPSVKTTKENLEDAIADEKYDSEVSYPQFLEQANTDKVKDAQVAFGSALKVEKGHLALFKEAYGNLDAWKKASAGFYVCTVCGNLVEKLNFAVCPVCKSPLSKFELVK
jgi:rubrerythrin